MDFIFYEWQNVRKLAGIDLYGLDASDNSSHIDEQKTLQGCAYCSKESFCFEKKCICNDGYSGKYCQLKDQTNDFRFLSSSLVLYEMNKQTYHPCYSKGYTNKKYNSIGLGSYSLCKKFIGKVYINDKCDIANVLCIKSYNKNNPVQYNSNKELKASGFLLNAGIFFDIKRIDYSKYLVLVEKYCQTDINGLVAKYKIDEKF